MSGSEKYPNPDDEYKPVPRRWVGMVVGYSILFWLAVILLLIYFL